MKKITRYIFLLPLLVLLWGCFKDNYPGAELSPYIAIYDIRNLYKGNDVTLSVENMRGANKIAATVVSDHSGGNMPAGLLVLQDARRISALRGIAISLGNQAAQYVPGDSLVINVEGGVLKRVDGILQITGIAQNRITKVSSGNAIPVSRVTANLIQADPGKYECVLSAIVKGGFDPLPGPNDVLAGDKVLNDGFGNLTLHTEANAGFANDKAPVMANFYGIVFNTQVKDQLVPQFRVRKSADVVVLSSTIEIAPILITGFLNSPTINSVNTSDANYEYIQFMATRDIDFAVTPYSVVTTNNAGASTPTGNPVNGWATGGLRTYKFNITSGKAAKGTFFYVGGTAKLINGNGSTNISTSNWVKALNYATTDGADFGTKTGNLLANSGNAFGMAVFAGTTVTTDTRPVDVIFISNGGSLYSAGPPARGYRITNTDFYDLKNPITLEDQPYYRAGSNTSFFTYNPSGQGYFTMLSGEYSPGLGRWTKARVQNNILLTPTSTIDQIENDNAAKLK